MQSTDGGKTWSGFRGAPGGDDYQNLWINPNNPNIILLVSDQGALVTVNGGANLEFLVQPAHRAALSRHCRQSPSPTASAAGQQESGSVCISSRGNDGAITFREWHPVGVIEYGYVAPDPLDPDIVYGGGQKRSLKIPLVHRPGAECHPIPLRTSKYRTDRTEPTDVLARGSAHRFITPAMCSSRRPTAEIPGRPSAKISLAKIPASLPASAALFPKEPTNSAASFTLSRLPSKTSTRSGLAPTMASSGSREMAAKTGMTSRPRI